MREGGGGGESVSGDKEGLDTRTAASAAYIHSYIVWSARLVRLRLPLLLVMLVFLLL